MWSTPISGLASRAALTSVTRLLNQGLVLISPIVLVRLLTVEDYGRYREFLVYVSVLVGIGAFGINSSLLRFIPHHPLDKQRFVNQSVLLTFLSSLGMIGAALALDALSGGAVLAGYALPVALYVFFFVNLDHWEFMWLAQRRPVPVFAYTTGRLVARLGVVIAVAALTHEVVTIIWSLVCLEAVRFAMSLFVWLGSARTARVSSEQTWKEQLRYCMPFGTSLMVVTLNKWLGNLIVAKAIGPVGLAHYTVGTYVQPIITALRNSFSDVLLPEMTDGDRNKREHGLELWRRTTVVIAIFLLAATIVLGRFADTVIVFLFSEQYRPAVPLFQLYLLVLVRECIDFGVPLRTINRTGPILHGNMWALGVNAIVALTLIPFVGLIGAVAAYVASRFVEGAYLGWRTMQAYDIRLRELAQWNDLTKVLVAGLVAAIPLYVSRALDDHGIGGAIVGGMLFVAMFSMMLRLLRVPEFVLLWRRCLRIPREMLLRR